VLAKQGGSGNPHPYDTLAHEAWHVLEDRDNTLVDGRANSHYPYTRAATGAETTNLMVTGSMSREEGGIYDSRRLTSEQEARTTTTHPELIYSAS
jgi:hypothetical protein